jgi:pullulanase/glycogen debranching enzyme
VLVGTVYHADSRKKYNWGYNPVDYSTKSTYYLLL